MLITRVNVTELTEACFSLFPIPPRQNIILPLIDMAIMYARSADALSMILLIALYYDDSYRAADSRKVQYTDS
jgi:hypothetical protein